MTKKSFPLRINEQVIAAMQRWADDDLRSLNAQIEFVLRDALMKSGRVKLVQKVVTDVEMQEVEMQEPDETDNQ
ncbi:MAG: hypothetical protein B0W54_08990 [Cellvibrio sp. 79]|nr:MAG: hypothetical protein B0W54_08990 [Cellvibrio sp. 79]